MYKFFGLFFIRATTWLMHRALLNRKNVPQSVLLLQINVTFGIIPIGWIRFFKHANMISR